MKFELTVEEANLVLTALGRMPYESVFQLINNMQQQAQNQIDKPEEESE